MLQGILIINLNRRPDRLQSLLQFIQGSDLATVSIYRLAAHDGSTINYTDGLLTPQALYELEQLRIKGFRDFHAQLSVGAIGCYLSHVDAWKFIAENSGADDTAPYLILEDDAEVPPAVMEAIAKAWKASTLESAGKPFILLAHIICLSGCGKRTDGMIIPERFWSFQAYLINGKTAKALLEAGMFPIDVQIDSQILYYRNAGILNVYAYKIMADAATDTDIQVNIRANAPLDRFKMLTL